MIRIEPCNPGRTLAVTLTCDQPKCLCVARLTTEFYSTARSELTKRGWVVLASDASHFYDNVEAMAPFPIVYNVGDMLDSLRKLQRLAETPAHIVPGHDPLVLARYPAPSAALQGAVVRLDVAPTE